MKLGAGSHHFYNVAGFYGAADNAEKYYNALVRVVVGVKNKRFKRCGAVALRGGQVGNYALEHLFNIGAALCRNHRRVLRGDTYNVLDFVLDPLRVGRGQVDFVDNRQKFQIVIYCKVGVGKGLRLDTLRGVDNKHRALAGGKRARHLVVKVDVAGGVDKIKLVLFAVGGGVVKGYGVRLYGYTALAFKVHTVEYLVLHIALCYRVGKLQHTVSQGRLAVVDMGDYTKVADVFKFKSHLFALLFQITFYYIIKMRFYQEK